MAGRSGRLTNLAFRAAPGQQAVDLGIAADVGDVEVNAWRRLERRGIVAA
jgi:hypothetical protein